LKKNAKRKFVKQFSTQKKNDIKKNVILANVIYKMKKE